METQNTKPTKQQDAAPIANEPALSPPPESPPTKSGKTKEKWSLKKLILVIAGSVFAFIAILLVIVSLATSGPVKVSDEFVANIQANQGNKAYDQLSTAAQSTVSLNDFTATINQISPILSGKPNLQSKEIGTETGKSNAAKVVYKIDGSDGIIYEMIINLVQIDDTWKVLNFESKKID